MTLNVRRSGNTFLYIFLPWVVWLAATVLYVATAAPSIVEFFDDSLEFQLVGPTFGIAHPTGYPLYTLLGGLWSRVLFPFGNWAWRMNLFSALAAGGAVAVVFLIGRELYGIYGLRLTDHEVGASAIDEGEPVSSVEYRLSSDLCALAAAVIFALGPVWWGQATVAEVYALHGLFVAGVLYGAIRVGKAGHGDARRRHGDSQRKAQGGGDRERGRQGEGETGRGEDRLWANRILSSPIRRIGRHLVFFVCGLALTHHRTTLLLAPGVAVYLLWSVPNIWQPQRRWVGWSLALFVPLLLYLYIPLRAAMGVVDLNGSYANSWSGFWDHLLARGYVGFFAENELAVVRSVGGLGDALCGAEWVGSVVVWAGRVDWNGVSQAKAGHREH